MDESARGKGHQEEGRIRKSKKHQWTITGREAATAYCYTAMEAGASSPEGREATINLFLPSRLYH
jgi:hypothetical protein